MHLGEAAGIKFQQSPAGEDVILVRYTHTRCPKYFSTKFRFYYLHFSEQIPDWQFPYKKSFHPVCIHDERELVKMTLKNCEEGTEPGTEIFEYYEAVSCKCSACKSSEASCEGLRLVDSNFHPQLL